MDDTNKEWIDTENPYRYSKLADAWEQGASSTIEHFEKQIKSGELSDGYHTFNELYDYRMIYNAMIVNEFASRELYNCHKSLKHHDGNYCFGGGWFIMTMDLPTGQVSNHYPTKYWELFKCVEKPMADEWDGHTLAEAFDRMYAYVLNAQQGKCPF